MTGLKLNLGCGEKRLPGHINVDKFGNPDLKHDLEIFPWPWPNDSIAEIQLHHVLEHLGKETEVYLGIIKEMYRVCHAGAKIHITVPHFRHDFYFDDPTHVRAVTPMGLKLFSKRLNREWIAKGAANSPLGIYLEVNFELRSLRLKPGIEWYRRHPDKPDDMQLLLQESALYNNLIEEFEMELEVIK